jgi:hypothetical protein
MRKWIAGLALSFVALLCAIPIQAADQTYSKTVPLVNGGVVNLENVNGSVELRGWDRDAVEIHAVKTARRAASDLDRVEIEVRSQPGRVEILTHYPKDQGVDVSVEYEVRVPKGAVLEHVATVNGNVRIAGVAGGGDLRTINGNVEAYGCAGSLSARTTNGNIREELWSLGSTEMALETVNGSVILALPQDAGAELDARSMNGDVHSGLPIAVTSAFAPGSFHGTLGAGGALLHIHTVNGAIQLTVLNGTI